MNTLQEILGKEWYNLIGEEFSQPYMAELSSILQEERRTKTIYPASEDVFRVFSETPYSEIRVVILAQDPFHDGSATGLAFDNSKTTRLSPSLRNIFKEIEDDCYNGLQIDQDPDLSRWSKQGVFLYNCALTVEQGKPGSHRQLWVNFTIKVLEWLSKNPDIIWLLWGSHAKAYHSNGFIKSDNILTAVHPSPLSANRGWFGCKHFSKTNEILKQQGNKEIIW